MTGSPLIIFNRSPQKLCTALLYSVQIVLIMMSWAPLEMTKMSLAPNMKVNFNQVVVMMMMSRVPLVLRKMRLAKVMTMNLVPVVTMRMS